MYRISYFLLLVTFQPSFGQTTNISIEAGITHSNFAGGSTAANSFYHTTVAPVTTGFGGLCLQTNLRESYRFFASLYFGAKGAHVGRTDYSGADERNIFINYISIPISVGYKILSVKHGGLWTALGVYGALAVSGIEKGTYVFLTNSPSVVYNNIKIRSTNPDQVSPTNVRPFDWGVHASLCYEMRKIQLAINYSAGFAGVLTNSSLYDRQYYNNNISLIAGYRLITLRKNPIRMSGLSTR
jgi:hypothetical protein